MVNTYTISQSLAELLNSSERERESAHRAYHEEFMSVVDNEIQAEFILDGIAPSVLDRYHRAFEDHNRVAKMMEAHLKNHGGQQA
jgi:hypothetical protein